MPKVINCLAEMALQHSMDFELEGGGERVLEDFVNLLKKIGYKVNLYQFSHEYKVARFRGHKIQGIGNITNKYNPVSGFKQGLEYFIKKSNEEAQGIYLLSMNLAMCSFNLPTITTSHGIMFNHCEKNNFLNPIESLDRFKSWIRNSTHTISCDTDTMHLMSVYYPENIKKMTYIPNYVDLNKFTPKEKKDDGIFRILYPRRLQHARGYHTLMSAADILLDKYQNIEILFIGKGNKAETDDLHNWMQKKDKRVKHYEYKYYQMPSAYDNVSVGLVPTAYSEGTSLSCLELLASNVLPITTWVGGLSDIVQPNVNGIVIQPNNPSELIKAIEYVMNNPLEVNRMRDNGLRMIKSFSKEIWEKRITDVVKKVYGEP